MISEPLLWLFLSSPVFISVTLFFSTSLLPSQQPPQPFAVEPPTSSSRRPWVPDLQLQSLRSFTLHKPLPLASPLQISLRLRFWSYHRDCLAPIYKIVKAPTPSKTTRAPTRRPKFMYCWSHPPRAVTRLQAPQHAVTRCHAPALASFLLLMSALGDVICHVICHSICWHHRWPGRWLDRWPTLTLTECWLCQSWLFAVQVLLTQFFM